MRARRSTRRYALALAAACTCVAAGGAAGAGGATIVLRVTTDPAPSRASWTYAGLPSPVRLDDAKPEASVSVAPGVYAVYERGTAIAQPPTLTGLACADPSHDSRATVRTATARVAVASGETVECTFVHRALGPRPQASAEELARRFAPELRLAAGERYRPLAIPAYLGVSTLRSGSPPRGATLEPEPTLFTLPVTTPSTYLDVRGPQPNSNASRYPLIARELQQTEPRPTVYWHLARQPSTGRIALEYWFLYLYNDFYVRHEADWEGVTVFLEKGAPIGAAYSQHQGRQWVPWGAAPADAGPTVYVGKGSHADYPLPGTRRVKVCWSLGGRHCTATRLTDVARGDGARLAPSAYDLHELGGAGFTGSWGSGSYVLGVGLTKDWIVDPRRRADYSNPFAAVPSRPPAAP